MGTYMGKSFVTFQSTKLLITIVGIMPTYIGSKHNEGLGFGNIYIFSSKSPRQQTFVFVK
jgi:hypothetical protein